jgi:hypothetical protein
VSPGGEEPVPARLQLRAQIAEVIDRAVEHHRQTQGRVQHGLMGTLGEIQDGQPPVSEGERPVAPHAFMIGTAPLQAIQHAPDGGELGEHPVEIQFTADAAHRSSGKSQVASGKEVRTRKQNAEFKFCCPPHTKQIILSRADPECPNRTLHLPSSSSLPLETCHLPLCQRHHRPVSRW